MTVRAHHRVCGENASSSGPVSPKTGSSPRVRGKLKYLHTRVSLFRLITACAGKTSISRIAVSPGSAHPRVCEENTAWAVETISVPGSSPRARRKHPVPGPVELLHGLIPACARKTARSSRYAAISSAHPRVRGENQAAVSLLVHTNGSYPRVRGKL